MGGIGRACTGRVVAQGDARTRARGQAAGAIRDDAVGAQLDEAAKAVADQAARVQGSTKGAPRVGGVAACARGAHPPVPGPQGRHLPSVAILACPVHRLRHATAPRFLEPTVATAAPDAVANDAGRAQEGALERRGRAALLHALLGGARVAGGAEAATAGRGELAGAGAILPGDSRQKEGAKPLARLGVAVPRVRSATTAVAKVRVGGTGARVRDAAARRTPSAARTRRTAQIAARTAFLPARPGGDGAVKVERPDAHRLLRRHAGPAV